MCYISSFLFIPYGSSILPLSKIQQGAHTICFCSRLLFYSKCTGFTVCFTYSDISLLTLSLLDLMSSSGISVMSSAEWSLVRKCFETVVGLDTGWVVNWSAVFFETVFESSFGFTYVFIWSSGCIASCKWRFLSYSRSDEWSDELGLVSPVEICRVECVWSLSRQICIWKWDSFFRMGMSPRAGCVVWDFEVWP